MSGDVYLWTRMKIIDVTNIESTRQQTAGTEKDKNCNSTILLKKIYRKTAPQTSYTKSTWCSFEFIHQMKSEAVLVGMQPDMKQRCISSVYYTHVGRVVAFSTNMCIIRELKMPRCEWHLKFNYATLCSARKHRTLYPHFLS